jgi:hypothetical protein
MKRPATTAYIAAAEYLDILRFQLGKPSVDTTLSHNLLAAAEALHVAARAVWLSSDEERDWSIDGESGGGDRNGSGDGDDTLLAVCPSDVADELQIPDWACPIDPVTGEPTDDGRVDVALPEPLWVDCA